MMRKATILAAGLGLALAAGASLSRVEAACSPRGNWCNYTYWASNAFEAPWDRVSEGVYQGDKRERTKRHRYYQYRHDEKKRK